MKTDELLARLDSLSDNEVCRLAAAAIRSLAAQLEAERKAREGAIKFWSEIRDGNWLDKDGCCKVCDGEIPHGHTSNCHIYKLEQRAEFAERRLAEVEQEARRYRWLRNDNSKFGWQGKNGMTGEQIDTAIDAAIKESAAQKKSK